MGIPLGLGIPAWIGKIPLAFSAVLSIRPIDPGNHHIDSITRGAFDRLHIAQLNMLEGPHTRGAELILDEAISMINLSQRWRALRSSLLPVAVRFGLVMI